MPENQSGVRIYMTYTNNWNEIRTAYKLAKLGTISATSKALGVHRSTVTRHIDTLEEELGAILFLRNDKGYIPTEAGLRVMKLGEITDENILQLSSKLKHNESSIEGVLKITCLTEMLSSIMPSVSDYKSRHPKMRVEIIPDIRNFSLEYGEADIAIRAGNKPNTPDNIVWPLCTLPMVLCVHKKYIEKFGLPEKDNLFQHRFIAFKTRVPHLTWNEWMHNEVPGQQITLFGSNYQSVVDALVSGCGIAVFPKQLIEEREDLSEIIHDHNWTLSLWALVHRDMKNVPKIRKFLDILLENAKESIANRVI